MKRHWRSLFFLLGPCMVYGWLVSALLIWGMIPGLTYLSCLVIAACVTPTDPILAQAVVGGKFADRHVPTHIRHLLSAESGSNDGAAFPFLYIALYLTLDSSPGHAVGEWFYMTWVYEVLLGIILGGLLGFTARKVMQFSERKKLIDRQSFVAQYVSLALLSIGICTLLGSDDLLAAFACGCAFAWDGYFNKATEDAVFSNVIDLLFNCAAFIYIGAIIPFTSFANAEFHLSVWRLIVLAILILIVRRMPVILALYKFIPDIKTFREAAFVGWFGPMGVGAIFISTLARTNIPEPENDGDTSQVDLLQETIGPIVAMLVLASVLTHGLSIPFFVSGRRVHSITNTWSRNPSMDTRIGNEPAWTTHTRRLDNGQQIVINRDDEEGDIGVIQRPRLDMNREKSIAIDEGSRASSGSDVSGSGSAGDSSTRNDNGVAYKDMAVAGAAGTLRARKAKEELHIDNGRRTPPIAEFQEGNDLVIERRRADDEVEVEVKKEYFKDHKDADKNFIEMTDRAGSPSRPTFVLPEGDEPRRRPGTPDSGHSTNFSDHSTNAGSDDEDAGDGYVRPRPYQNVREPSPPPESVRRGSTVSSISQAPAIHSYIPASRIKKEEKGSSWRRFLRVGTTSSNTSSHSAAEEGRGHSPSPSRYGQGHEHAHAHHDEGFLSVPARRAAALGVPRIQTLEPDDDHDHTNHNDRSLQLTRTLSRAISFAPDLAQSSETAPTMSNYGNANPTFKRTPSLGMYRTSSVRSIDEEEVPAFK